MPLSLQRLPFLCSTRVKLDSFYDGGHVPSFSRLPGISSRTQWQAHRKVRLHQQVALSMPLSSCLSPVSCAKVYYYTQYRNSLYPCYERTQGSTIDPQGKLSYCLVERSFGIDVLSENDIWESYLEKARQLQKKVFPPNSPCANCKIRMLCPQCPGRSYLLGVNPYQPVDYYCELAKERFKSRELYLR